MNPASATASSGAAPETPTRAGFTGSHLDLVPVDPHRVFVQWELAAPAIERLREMAAPAPEHAHLTLRVFRLPDADSSLLAASSVEDFPVGATRHEGFFSVTEPGGCVAAVLGFKNSANRFTPALTSTRVTLPEAPRTLPEEASALIELELEEPPASAPPAEPLPAMTSVAPPAPRGFAPVLDERAVLAAATRLAGLPPELRVLPPREDEAAPAPLRDDRPTPTPFAAVPPETPILNERAIVTAALRSLIADAPSPTIATGPARVGSLRPALPASPPASSAAASAHRLASQISAESSAAPIQLRANLVVTGRLAPGQRLRMGDREVAAGPGGEFSFQQPLNAMSAAWSLLLQVLVQTPEKSLPSLELLGQIPDAEALLALHAYVEIEGEVRDPAYLARLPEGIVLDGAGKFRIVRPLPAGALLAPHLVLVATERDEG